MANPYSRVKDPNWVLQARREVIVVGGFLPDTERHVIVDQLKTMVLADPGRGWTGAGVVDCYAPGQFGCIGKIKFTNPDRLWALLKAFKGYKFSWQGRLLFHSIEKTMAEQELSRRVSRAAKIIREHLEAIGRLAVDAS